MTMIFISDRTSGKMYVAEKFNTEKEARDFAFFMIKIGEEVGIDNSSNLIEMVNLDDII